MKLRRNHKSRGGGLNVVRIVVFVILLLLVLYMIYNGMNRPISNEAYSYEGYDLVLNDTEDQSSTKYSYLPSNNGEVVHHDNYSLSYREDHEQAEWVAYELTEDMLRMPNVPRHDRFMKDDKVSTGSTGYYDYRGSGYTRGHLVPAGDMAHSKEAMKQTFFMSNISPQVRVFNNGIWKELEEQVRDWVFHNDKLYIVSGPILTSSRYKTFSKKQISVPEEFFKIVLDNTGKSKKAIGFVIPHGRSELKLQEYAVTIDSIEQMTGIDFFMHMDSDPVIESIEAAYNLKDWDFSEARHRLRVDKWNNQ